MNKNTEYLGCKFEDSQNVVFFHHPCQDGFSAAWAAHRYLGSHDTCYWGTTYTDEFWNTPAKELDYGPFVGKRVFIVDFSFPVDVLLELAEYATSVVVFDHHVKFKRLVQDHPLHFEVSGPFGEPHDNPTADERLPTNITQITLCDDCVVYFHDYLCGAQITMYALSMVADMPVAPPTQFPYHVMQNMLAYIGDRDLWYWQMPNSREIHRVLALEERTFEAWTRFALNLSNQEDFDRLVQTGSVLGKSEEVQISSSVRRAELLDFPGQDQKIPVANVTNLISEVGQALLDAYPDAPFSATFFYPETGKRVWSLRARKGDDVDVCAVAAQFGGGGHRKAAGFHQDIGLSIG